MAQTTLGRAFDHAVIAVQNLQAIAQQYEAMGFTVTPTAHHNDEMGTSNRLVQLSNKTFIELLEVDRPETVKAHDFDANPPCFSFGAHNREFLSDVQGMSMLVFQTDDAIADIKKWQSTNVPTYSPYHFERYATLPDGSRAELSFSLGFASSPDMPRCSYFVCQNDAPHHFWKETFQRHANCAKGIVSVTVCTENPERDADFVCSLFGGVQTSDETGIKIKVTDTQTIQFAHPEMVASIDQSVETRADLLPRFVGITIATGNPASRGLIPAATAGGVYLQLV